MNLHSLPILYTFRRCPYAMRARMAIGVAQIEVEQIEISLKNKPQSLLNYSPKGTVPVLVTVDGDVIEQSRDIMFWALRQCDPENWLLENDKTTQTAMMSLVDECDFSFKPVLDRYKYFDRYPECSQIQYRQQAEKFLQQLDDKLSVNPFLIDEKMRFVDVAIFPFIRQFAGVDNAWFAESPYQHLRNWLEIFITSKLFFTTMQKKK
ncbi:MAG: glutathione S-transferase [Sphingobacteriales bacterium]|nr:MAG: glutathione S-transferase [Sphingobacteriales bacterium]